MIAALVVVAAQLELVVAPQQVVLGGQPAPAVSVQHAPPGATLRFASSIGEIDGGKLSLGDRRAPAWVIVGVDAGEAARGATVVELVGSGALPTETKPGASVTVEIAGRRFGPVTADGKGRAQVPVEVPPSATLATVQAVDSNGLSTEREVPLPRASWPRALVLAPASLREGDEGVVTVFAIGEEGKWRDARAAAPVLALPAELELVEPPAAVAAGRWDARVRARAAAASVAIGATVDGESAVAATIEVTALPVGETPGGPPPLLRARREPWRVGAWVGVASAFGPLTTTAAGVEVAAPLTRGKPRLLLAAQLAAASGEATRFQGVDSETDVTMVWFGVAARLRAGLAWKLAAEAELGLGVLVSSSTVVKQAGMMKPEDVDGTAPILWLGGALARGLGPGEAVLSLRYADARLPGDTRVEGNAIGLLVTLGFRIGF